MLAGQCCAMIKILGAITAALQPLSYAPTTSWSPSADTPSKIALAEYRLLKFKIAREVKKTNKRTLIFFTSLL